MAQEKDFGTLRLKRDTIDYLKNLKDAYELCYGKRMTFDEFIRKVTDSIEDGDPGVWDVYCKQQELRDNAAKARLEQEYNK